MSKTLAQQMELITATPAPEIEPEVVKLESYADLPKQTYWAATPATPGVQAASLETFRQRFGCAPAKIYLLFGYIYMLIPEGVQAHSGWMKAKEA